MTLKTLIHHALDLGRRHKGANNGCKKPRFRRNQSLAAQPLPLSQWAQRAPARQMSLCSLLVQTHEGHKMSGRPWRSLAQILKQSRGLCQGSHSRATARTPRRCPRPPSSSERLALHTREPLHAIVGVNNTRSAHIVRQRPNGAVGRSHHVERATSAIWGSIRRGARAVHARCGYWGCSTDPFIQSQSGGMVTPQSPAGTIYNSSPSRPSPREVVQIPDAVRTRCARGADTPPLASFSAKKVTNLRGEPNSGCQTARGSWAWATHRRSHSAGFFVCVHQRLPAPWITEALKGTQRARHECDHCGRCPAALGPAHAKRVRIACAAPLLMSKAF